MLRWRHSGATYAEIGARFRRSPSFVARVETLAQYKLEGLVQQEDRRPEQSSS